jgi:cytochrome c553
MDRNARLWGAALLLTLGACSTSEPESAQAFTATGELVAMSGGGSGAQNACFTCHGLNGEGNGAGAPRLAGLEAGYLLKQLDDFAAGTRRHPEMSAIARHLEPRSRMMVAHYYAAMPLPPAETEAKPAPTLYVEGDPARDLPACATCHGLRGEGVGRANPALARQPAAYLAAQLYAWRQSERRNDPGNVMLDISRHLTPAEIATLADYAGGLPGLSPHRESPEGSRAARRFGPRNGASAPPPHGAARAPGAR